MRARETHIAESSLDHEQKAEDTAEREKNMLFRPCSVLPCVS